MKLPRFEVHRPRTIDEAVALAARFAPDLDWLAGGTDLLPNYKCRLNVRSHVVMLSGVDELHGISATRIGALARLSDLEKDEPLGKALPVVREAVRQLASPLLRQSGTLGGNLCLDNRCYYFNQSDFWRDAKGGCLKEGGPICLVVPGQKEDTCWAAYSGDLAPVLQVLGASVGIAGPGGRRSVPLTEFFRPDGIRRNVLEKHELVTHVDLPASAGALRAGYVKLRQRDAIDFPILGIAIGLRMEGATVAEARASITAMDVTPLFVELPAGEAPTAGWAERAAEVLRKRVQPVKNVSLRPTYRKRMAGVLGRRLLERLGGISPTPAPATRPHAPAGP